MDNMAETVKVGSKYYREGVEVASPMNEKNKIVIKGAPVKPMSGGLAGDDKIANAINETKRIQRLGSNPIGAGLDMIKRMATR